MMAQNGGYIFAAYAIAFVAIGGAIGAIVLRHRALKRALARFPESGQRPS